MKTKILLAIALCVGLTSFGQDNTAGPTQSNRLGSLSISVPPQVKTGMGEIWDAASNPTNFAVMVGGGRSLHRNYNIVFVDYIYDIVRSENGTAAGFVLGFDDIAKGTDFTTDSIAFVKGGVSLSMEIRPLKNFGAPNFKLTPYTSMLIADSGSKVGSIEVVGFNWHADIYRGWYLNLGAFWESRNGTGQDTDTTYLCGTLSVSKGF